MPEVKKAELIEGTVYMPSPVRVQAHSRPHPMINTWLGTYWAHPPGTDCGNNASIFLDLDNEPQPDAYLRLTEAAGGKSRETASDYLEGPPELIVEIAASSASSASSASYDLHQKKAVYARSDVQEYIAWRTEDRPWTGGNSPRANTHRLPKTRSAGSEAGSSPVSFSPCPPFSSATSERHSPH